MAVDWENGQLTEDEEGQLEVIRALPPSACDAADLLSTSSLRRSGLLDLIPEGKKLSASCFECRACVWSGTDPRARQLLEKLLKKGAGVSGLGPKVPIPSRARNEVVAPVAPVGQSVSRTSRQPREHDQGKRPMVEEGEPLVTKRVRTEE
ncbi:unnamed protein product, partial [Prunus brigantina]